MPALLNTRLTWSVSWSARTWSRKAIIWASSDTSATKVVTRVPAGASFSASAFDSAMFSSDTSHIATWAPAGDSWRTSSRPMPRAPTGDDGDPSLEAVHVVHSPMSIGTADDESPTDLTERSRS